MQQFTSNNSFMNKSIQDYANKTLVAGRFGASSDSFILPYSDQSAPRHSSLKNDAGTHQSIKPQLMRVPEQSQSSGGQKLVSIQVNINDLNKASSKKIR